MDNKYRLIVYGLSNYPSTKNVFFSLIGKYKLLNEQHNLQVVYLSLGIEISSLDFFNEASYEMFYDYFEWDSLIDKNYHVFTTPTYLIFYRNLKFLTKIRSPEFFEQ